MDNIHYNFIDVEIPDFDPEFFGLWISKVVNEHNMNIGELSFVFCSDEKLLEMNREFLNHDFYTDVITFNYNEEDSLSGDVFISVDRVKDNASLYGNKSEFDELCRVMIHGVLHLLGFNDKTEDEKAAMKSKENECLLLR
ncbi:MAG: rRNA maturation RNase YbeY [Crocinitomicaceae bacterium]|nr:rRNA maturation RNase YbeY [Crocinitomicaceae bacterium]